MSQSNPPSRIEVVKCIENIYSMLDVVVGNPIARKHILQFIASQVRALAVGMASGGSLSPRKQYRWVTAVNGVARNRRVLDATHPVCPVLIVTRVFGNIKWTCSQKTVSSNMIIPVFLQCSH